jgi:hypothetical protein
VTAEHTSGASVDHPCTKGVFSDPADTFWETVVADSEEQARKIGEELLEKLVMDAKPCGCQLAKEPGWSSWWDSVCVSACPLVADGEMAEFAIRDESGAIRLAASAEEALPGESFVSLNDLPYDDLCNSTYSDLWNMVENR